MADDPRPYSQVEQTIDGKGNKAILASLLAPQLKAAYAATTRAKSAIRSLRVLNALETHVAAGSDTAPKLTDLGLPAEAITDPFNGELLHVKRMPQGWLVYSVGPNLQDNGGKIDDPNNGDVGVGPPPPVAKPSEGGKP